MVVRNSTTTFLYSTENLPDNTMKLADALTAKNTVISSNFLVWKFCGKAQFRIAQNYAETVPFYEIFTQGNLVKLVYFSQ